MLIERADRVTDELLDALNRLTPQLKIDSPRLTRDGLAGLLASDSVALLIARADESAPILGAATLIVYPTPTGVRARLEDVIVDEFARRGGVASALIQSALEVARQRGAGGVALTSNERREAANRLYLKLGFAVWETNVYYFKFGG